MSNGSVTAHGRWRARLPVLAMIMAIGMIVGACASTDASTTAEPSALPGVDSEPESLGDVDLVEAQLTSQRLSAPTTCSTGFVGHDLDHTTTGPGDTASTFDGTGAGVGIGDLDRDGDLDIVLANLSSTSTILENQGELSFSSHALEAGRFRAVAIVDASGDHWPDIVMTTGLGTPVIYTNPGTGDLDSWERGVIDGVRAIAYSMAWTDLSGDGDLDLVTGSYNAELTFRRNSPVLGDDTGVILHERDGDDFTVTRLSETAQALALVTSDIDGDGRTDIYVGNDLATPDFLWLDTATGWTPTTPFTTTSYSTMSVDSADLDNDGRNEFFTTDMAPAEPDDRYREVAEDLAAAPVVDDIQIPVNVLNDPDGSTFTNLAPGEAIETTGWSWSGLFGDLDNDGLQDLYVANGMRSDALFDFLPDARLVEENQAFRNESGNLVPVDEWGLGAVEGGRGMAFADLDSDGDLDIVINNLDTPSRLFENQLCGNAVEVELEWLGTDNIDALGATVSLQAGEETLTRSITSSRGYLSSSPPTAHFGVGQTEIGDITVTWPDGRTSTVSNVDVNSRHTISR